MFETAGLPAKLVSCVAAMDEVGDKNKS